MLDLDVPRESLESTFPRWVRWIRIWRILHVIGLAVLTSAIVYYGTFRVPVLSPHFPIGMFVAFTSWGIPMNQLALLDCPRCHHRYFRTLIVSFLFQSRCCHCDLPQYDDEI